MKNGTRKRRLLAAIFFSWLLTLLALTYWPNLNDIEVKVGDEWWRTDYMGHFVFYMLLMVFFLLWQQARGITISSSYIIVVALVGVAFGAVTELSQQITPGRSLNPFDMLYNCLGILAGAAAFAVMLRRKRRVT